MNTSHRKIFSVSLVLLCCLCLCAFSFTKKIKLGGQKIPVNQTSIQCVLDAQELSKLDSFSFLQYADLTGSTCYDEIDAWMQAHPGVEVHYSVTFPDGSDADNQTDTLSLPFVSAENAGLCLDLLRHFPALRTLSLTGSRLSPAEASSFAAALPGVELSFDFELLGQSLNLHSEEIDLSSLSENELDTAISALSSLPELRKVYLGRKDDSALSWESIALLESTCPNAEFDGSFTLYDRPFTFSDTVMDLSYVPIYDEGELVRRVVACMPNLTYLDMDSCGLSNESMALLRDAFPSVTVVWRIWMGNTYSVRTDVERILVSHPSTAGVLTDALIAPIKYCTKVKYLDIGHNELLTDISFTANMPELEVFIAAMNKISDISALANCKKLEYLEIQTNQISDISALSGLTELRHLNCARNNITDISPLFTIPKLERAWLGSSTKCPPEQIETLQSIALNCEINTSVFSDPTGERWRYIGSDPSPWSFEVYLHPRYELLQEQFGYTYQDFSFYWNDPEFHPPVYQ